MKRKAFLCVDDEAVVLQTLKFTLKSAFGEKFIYETATNSTEAIEIIEDLQRLEIDIILIISDWVMPSSEKSGSEFIDTVSERWPETKCIIVSGLIDQKSIDGLKNKANVIDHFLKPWSGMELISVIRKKVLNNL